MPLRLSEILEHDAPHLGVHSRQALLRFYDAIVDALRKGELTAEGGALPTKLGTLLAFLPGIHGLPKRDRDMTDWSVENDHKYAAFLERWRAATDQGRKGRTVRPVAAPLHQAVTKLQEIELSGGKKSDIQVAVSFFLDIYALSQHALRLPAIDRALPRQLPTGVELDDRAVALGDDDTGKFVGLVRRRAKKAGESPN